MAIYSNSIIQTFLNIGESSNSTVNNVGTGCCFILFFIVGVQLNDFFLTFTSKAKWGYLLEKKKYWLVYITKFHLNKTCTF